MKYHLVMKWFSSYAYCFIDEFHNIFLHSKPMWCIGIWQYWVSDVLKTSTFFCNYIQQVCFSYFVYFSVDYSGFLFFFLNKKEKTQKFSLSRIHLPTHMNKDEGPFNCYRTYFAALDIWVRSRLLISVIISLDMDKSND